MGHDWVSHVCGWEVMSTGDNSEESQMEDTCIESELKLVTFNINQK